MKKPTVHDSMVESRLPGALPRKRREGKSQIKRAAIVQKINLGS